MKSVHRFAVAAVLVVLGVGIAVAQTPYGVKKISGSIANQPISINNGGQVLVNSVVNGVSQIALWDRVHGKQSIPTLAGGGNLGYDLSNIGSIAGTGNPNNSGVSQAFTWQTGAPAQWLGSLGGGLSAAYGNNDGGSVVGLSYTAANLQHPFYWTKSGGMQDLMPGLTSIGGGSAQAVNTSNQVVGYYFPNGNTDTLGFLWTQTNGVQNIGALGTLAYDINDSGVVVGKTPVAAGGKHAFLWNSSTGIQDLGTLEGSDSTALNINHSGWVVGTSIATVSGKGLLHGFLWTPAGGMVDFVKLAGLSSTQQVYSVQINDSGVIAISTNVAEYVLIPKLTATFVSSANPSLAGQSVTFTVTMTSMAGPPPDGEMVQFLVSGKLTATGTLKNGVAQFAASFGVPGSYVITAKYNGDTNHLPVKFLLTQVVN